MSQRTAAAIAAALLVLGSIHLCSAHEVDQYRLPDEKLQDLGNYWNTMLFEAVRDGAESLNRDIRIANKLPIPEARRAALAHLHAPGTVARRVRMQIPSALVIIEGLEWKFRLGLIQANQNQTLPGYRSPFILSSFSHVPRLPDPRQINRMLFLRCSLVKVHDVYMGTDKIGHFFGMGYIYYTTYSTLRHLGNSHDDAVRRTVQIHKYGPISENALIGMIPTGVYSNGDMAANYVGMKFFTNLTRPIQLNGCEHPSMLVRDGDLWKLRPHVTADGPVFASFVSEHFDEVLNPCVFEPTMRGPHKATAAREAKKLLDWYANHDPAKRTPEYFRRIQKRCETYFGEDYGHAGEGDELVTLADICFPRRGETEAAASPVQLAAGTTPVSKAHIRVDAVGPSFHPLKQSEIYEVYVTNEGPRSYENVTVTINIVPSLEVTAVDTPALYDGTLRTLAWRVPILPHGKTGCFKFKATAVAEGTYVAGIKAHHDQAQVASVRYQTEIVSQDDTFVTLTDVPDDASSQRATVPASHVATAANGSSAKPCGCNRR